jgi:hypothetical protein
LALFTPCQIASLSCLGGRGKNILWHFCQAVKYGLIVTPAIMRRLVGWCLLYFPAVRYCLSVCFCLYQFCRSFARKRKRIYTKKTQKSFVTLLPMAERLAIRGFRGNKIQILTLLPFVTAPVFLM